MCAANRGLRPLARPPLRSHGQGLSLAYRSFRAPPVTCGQCWSVSSVLPSPDRLRPGKDCQVRMPPSGLEEATPGLGRFPQSPWEDACGRQSTWASGPGPAGGCGAWTSPEASSCCSLWQIVPPSLVSGLHAEVASRCPLYRNVSPLASASAPDLEHISPISDPGSPPPRPYGLRCLCRGPVAGWCPRPREAWGR